MCVPLKAEVKATWRFGHIARFILVLQLIESYNWLKSQRVHHKLSRGWGQDRNFELFASPAD